MPNFMSAAPLRLIASAVMLLAASFTASAADLTLTNLRYDAGIIKITIPRMDVRGTSLSENELRGILDGTGPGDAVSRLSRLQASSVSMPELVMVQDVGGTGSQTMTYRDISLTNIAGGVIGRMRAAGMTGEMTDPTVGKIPFTIGEMTAEGVDMPVSARALTTSVTDPAQVPLAPIYRSVSYRDYVINLPGAMGQISVASVVGRDAKARPGKEPLMTTFRGIMDMAEKQKADGNSKGDPSAADLAMIARMIGFFDNFEYGVMDAEGFKGSFKADKDAATFSIARMRFSDQAQQGGFAMLGLKVDAGPAKVSLGEFEMRDFGYRDSLKVLAEMLERGDMTAMMTGYGKLIPKLGTIRMKDFNLEAPDTSQRNRRGPPEIIRASVKSMELGFGQQVDGIPTAVRFSADEFAAPLPAGSREQSVRDLIAMGYKDVNLSWLADLAWAQDREQLNIKALNLSGKDMASLAFAGQLGNVSKDAFSTDTALAQVAWLSATAQRLTMTFENFGGIEKIVAREAAKAKKTPEALRREWGTLAAIGLPAILGDSDGAKAISGAIARFVARPGKLGIDITSRSPGGIGVADAVQAMGAPQALFEKLEVQARAE
ncbi:MAG: hypothetical protein ACRCUE_08800 [Bosea sp. (in: a-proteobacteria)]